MMNWEENMSQFFCGKQIKGKDLQHFQKTLHKNAIAKFNDLKYIYNFLN